MENAYLNAKCCEKIWFEGSLKCGEDIGKICIVIRALYGLKCVGASLHSELTQVLRDLRYMSTKADANVWI